MTEDGGQTTEDGRRRTHHRDTEDTEKGLNRLLFRDRSPKKSIFPGREMASREKMPLGNGEGRYGGQGKDSGQGSVVTGRTPQ